MIIQSLCDTDFYKFSMQMVVLHHFPSTDVKYKFVCRTKNIDLRPLKEEIEEEIDHLCSLKFTKEELNFLSSIRFLKKDYIDFLSDFTLKRKYVEVSNGFDGLEITISGPWLQCILFEVPILAIVSEVYCKKQIDINEAYENLHKNLDKKIEFYKGLKNKFPFADFGTRRRFSFDVQNGVVRDLKKEMPDTFTGSSNCYLCLTQDLVPIGTMAHEFISAGMGLGEVQLVKSQKYMLEKWAEEYRGDLGIALTDTINMDSFLIDFDLFLASLFSGCRQDSGDPYIWCEKLIAHYKKIRIDPLTKTAVFSDALDFEKASKIYDTFKDRIKVSFGIGTFLSNDCNIKPLSMVIKMTECNGNPVAKISDEPSKSICKDEEFLSYLKQVFKVPDYGNGKVKEEDIAKICKPICDEFKIKLTDVTIDSDYIKRAGMVGCEESFKNKSYSCCGELILGNYDNPELKLISFFHELGHNSLISQESLEDELISKMDTELECWRIGIAFAKKRNITFSEDAVAWGYKQAITYANYK